MKYKRTIHLLKGKFFGLLYAAKKLNLKKNCITGYLIKPNNIVFRFL